MKVLFVASIYRHLTTFHIPYMKYFQEQGYEVYAAGLGNENRQILEEMNIKCIDISFSRKPFNRENIKAYRDLKRLFSKETFSLVHVHTPVAALLTRAAFENSKIGKIIYTAHGFHFFKGAPLQNWLLYYPVEKIAAKWTDHLIVMNEEDYASAIKLLPSSKVSLTHGVGVEISDIRLSEIEKQKLRNTLGIKGNAVVISYIAELNTNKNHKFLFDNWEQIKKNNPQYELLVIGTGEKQQQLHQLVTEMNLKDIHFLGFRRDVRELLQITDIVTLLSLREGLPKSIMEAMAEALPCVVTNTRGLRDLIKPDMNGFVVDNGDNENLIKAFENLNNLRIRISMGLESKKEVDKYLLSNVLEEYKAIYNKIL